eukprot:scaffold210763_cov69-Attheya_sp.AAC.2
MMQVSMYEDMLESPTKLHSFRCRKGQGVSVNAKEGVINNCLRPALTLGDNTNGADAKVGKVLDSGIGEDHPLAFSDHVAEFSGQEVCMQVATMFPEIVVVSSGWVGNSLDVGREISWGAIAAYHLVPPMYLKQSSGCISMIT